MCILNTQYNTKIIIKSIKIVKFFIFIFYLLFFCLFLEGFDMKKFNNNRNVIGNLIKKHREDKHYTKTELSHKLELLGIELDRFELYKIETAKTSVKDFELIGLCIILDIDFEELKKLVEDCS